MNPVTTTIINPWKKYWLSWGSNQQPPVLKSGTLPTGLWGLAHILWIYISSNIFVKLLTPSKDKELRCCKVEFQLNEKCFQQTFGTAFLFHPWVWFRLSLHAKAASCLCIINFVSFYCQTPFPTSDMSIWCIYQCMLYSIYISVIDATFFQS